VQIIDIVLRKPQSVHAGIDMQQCIERAIARRLCYPGVDLAQMVEHGHEACSAKGRPVPIRCAHEDSDPGIGQYRAKFQPFARPGNEKPIAACPLQRSRNRGNAQAITVGLHHGVRFGGAEGLAQ